MKNFKEVHCPFCHNDGNLKWDTDRNYFDPSDKEYETKEIVTCSECDRKFSVFLRYKEISEDCIKDTDEIQYLGDKIFKLINIDICNNPEQQ